MLITSSVVLSVPMPCLMLLGLPGILVVILILPEARAGTLPNRVEDAGVGVAKVKLALVMGKHLPAGLHAAEASYVSASSFCSFRAALVRFVWSSEMPFTSTPVIRSLLDSSVAVDPAFHIIWARFPMMRWYLSYCPEEEPCIFRMLDLLSRGPQGHGPVHLLLTSVAEIGFAWDGNEKGWVRASLPP